MKVLAEANANAAISILHALGLGKGCSIGINLKTTVRLVSEPQKVEGDFHNLLPVSYTHLTLPTNREV